MNTLFPKYKLHIPKFYIIDAFNKTLGRITTEISILIRGKYNFYYNSNINQYNYIIIINSNNIYLNNKNNELKKKYYKNSKRPGSLKIENFKALKNRISNRIIEKSIWGMLPKGILGRNFYKYLYIYKNNKINI